MSDVAITPVKRMPNLSRMMPPKNSSSKNTLKYPYEPEKKPYSSDDHPIPRPPAVLAAVSSGSSGDITSVKK